MDYFLSFSCLFQYKSLYMYNIHQKIINAPKGGNLPMTLL